MPTPAELARYREPRRMTRLDRHAGALQELPTELAALCRVVQGLVVHPFHAELYELEHVRVEETQIRAAADMLDRIFALDPAPLTEPRPPERRFVGNCRHFSTLLVALLRHQGRAARARCGFGAYFEPDRYVDHWAGELFDEAAGRWRLVDAQIDDLQRAALGIDFDTTDVSREQFWVAGQAWQRARAGDVPAEHFGILDMWGLWFIQSNLTRDVASLNRVELLPWDDWGLGMKPLDGPDRDDVLARLDRLALLTVGDDPPATLLASLYEGDVELEVPRVITSFIDGVPTPVEIDVD